MHTRTRSLLSIALSTLAVGAGPAMLDVVFGHPSLRGAGRDMLQGVISSACIGTPCWLLMPRVAERLAGRSFAVRVGAALLVLGLCGVAGCGAAVLILAALHLITSADLSAVYFGSLRICLVITYGFGVVALVIGTLQQRLADVKQELHVRQMAEERERKVAAEARYASLESRVRPHFLFNTLNSISALVREDPAEAERMIERLSALLRSSLDSEASGVVTLREELRIVRDYLEIEKVRFGDRLRYRFDVDAAAEAGMVPALSIQTLVENSMKFAVGASRDGAEIVVTARMSGGQLRVEVSDDGPGFEPATSLKPGHGLDLLTRRLESLFGAAAALEMTAAKGRTMVALSVNS